jgi:TolB-like protein/DNA-binding winged helix-turn-helix (wHTH) protein
MADRIDAYRFGPYEVRPESREIYKHGLKLKLRPQPFQVLQVLVERPGEVVTRDEFRQRLWSAETFVDFEHGLNTSIKELRRVLSDSADAPTYIETLPRLGYRIIVPVDVERPQVPSQDASRMRGSTETLPEQPVVFHLAPTEAEEEAKEQQIAGPRTHPRTPVLRPWMTALAMILLLGAVAAGYAQWKRLRPRPVAAAGRIRLAVLPFENLTGDADQDYFSDGLTEEMLTNLGRLNPERLGVVARTSVMLYKHSPKPLDQIARELGVQYIIEGSVRRDSNHVRITAQLIQVQDQTHVWAKQYDRELKNLLVVQGEIAQEIADEIQLRLGDSGVHAGNPKVATPGPTSYEAYDLYLKGRYFWNKRSQAGFKQAAEYFQHAIDKDPKYARAYAGLADTFGLMSTWGMVSQNQFMPQARTAARKALELDETLAEAHTSLALVAQNEYDWQTAEKEFRRAIQLNPEYATAHHWYAEHLSLRGRFGEAFQESERARQLDPMSLIIAVDHSYLLFYSHQYDRAIAENRAVRDMDPNFPRRGVILWSYAEQGRFREAIEEINRLSPAWRSTQDSARLWALRANIHGRWGQHKQFRHALAEFERLAPSLPDRTFYEIIAYLGGDPKDKVMALLQKACSEHSNFVTALKVEPMYDPLRDDPRFRDLLHRVGLD